MAAISSRRRGGSADYTWPGYVDALTTLLMVLIFLLSLFSVAQFTLSDALNNSENAIDRLNKQVGDLGKHAVAREEGRREPAKGPRTAHPAASPEPDRARPIERRPRRPAQRADALKVERDQLTERLTSDAGGTREARYRAAGKRQGSRGQERRPTEGDRAPATGAHPARGLVGRGQYGKRQAVRRPHRGASSRRTEGSPSCA